MSIKVKYKANTFLEKLQDLETHFVFISKLYSLKYKDTKKYLKSSDGDIPFYPSFYVDRIKSLKEALKTFFDFNGKDLSSLADIYEVSIELSEKLQFTAISVFVSGLTEDLPLQKNLKSLKDKNFHKDQVLMNYLISLDGMLEDLGNLQWEEWLLKYTVVNLKEESVASLGSSYSDICFDEGPINFILEKEISEIDKLAYNLQKSIANNFDEFLESNPLTYVDNQLTENAEKQLRQLRSLKDRKGLKFSDKLRLMAKKVDGSEESIKLVLENLTLENFASLLEQILKCLPGILTIQEVVTLIIDGSFELLTEDFMQEILELFPPEITASLELEASVNFPWLDGSSEFSLIWFEAVLKEFDLVLKRLNFPSFFDYYTLLTPRPFPSSMYHMLKLHFKGEIPDIDFDVMLPTGTTLEEYFVLNFSFLEFDSIFDIGKLQYELFLLELINLHATIEELGEENPLPDFNMPSFENFEIPKITFPNFKNREITVLDLKHLLDFGKIYFPNINMPSIDFGSLNMGDPLSIELKIQFFNTLYQTVISYEVPNFKGIKPIFDDIFFNIKRLGLESPAIILVPGEIDFFAKLFTAKFSNKIPDMAFKFRNSFDFDLSGLDIQQSIFDISLKIPEIKNLFDTLQIDGFNIPSIKLEGFSKPDFNLKKLRLPDIPKLPSIKFNFVEFLSEKLYQVLLKVIIKIFLTLLARVIDAITLEICTDPQEGGLEQNEPDGGLKNLVGEIVCPDKDPEEEAINLVKKSIKNSSTPSQIEENKPNLETITKVVDALSVCSTISEMAPAILGRPEQIDPGYLHKIADVMNSVVPELSDQLGTPDKVAQFFEQAGNLMNEEQRNRLDDFISQAPVIEAPVSNTICLSKEALEEWQEDKKQLYTNAGFNDKIAEELINKQRDRAAKEMKEVIDLAVNTPDKLFSDAINDILNVDTGEDDDTGLEKNEDCEDPLKPKELTEKTADISNDLLDSLNSKFIDDMLVPEKPFQPFKGALSKILSDKHDRPMSDINGLKENFFLNFLIQIDVLPPIEFPESVMKDLTDSMNSLQYNHTEQTKTTPNILDKSLFSIPVLNKVKQTIAAINYKQPNITLDYDKNKTKPVEYMDYMYENPNLNGLKEGLHFIKPRNKKQEEFLEKFSSFGFSESTTPRQMFQYIFGEEYVSEYNSLNNRILRYMKKTFSDTVEFGYPEEITSDDIEVSGGDNETKTLAQLVNPNSRVEVLDPEIYGGTYEDPNIFIRPPDDDAAEGFYLYSKKLFSDSNNNKLDTTILKLSEVAKYIDKSKNKIEQKRYRRSQKIKEKEEILELPYSIMISSDKAANVLGYFKALIRVYLAEFFTLSYPVVKKLGIKYDNYGDLLFCYFQHRLSRDMDEFKNLGSPKNVYTPFVIYCLLLEQIGAEYINNKKNETSDYLNNKKQEYESLHKKDIEFLKSVQHNSKTLGLDKKLSSFVSGFAGISFNSSWKSVLDSTLGFDIKAMNLDEKEIRLASKIGYVLSDIDVIEDIVKEKIIEEAKEYEKLFIPEIQNIYTDFIQSSDGMNIDLQNIKFNPNTDSYYIKKYIKIITKEGLEIITDYNGLLSELEDIPELTSVSSRFGNAAIKDIYNLEYSGTIGIQFGVSFGYKDIEISKYEKDIEDVLFSELKEVGENLGEDILCFVDELLKTPNMELLFKYCLKVEKAGSLAGIYYMRNCIPSLGEGEDERQKQFALPFGNPLESIFGKPSPTSIYTQTKKEILKNISGFLYDEQKDPKPEEEKFTDYVKKQKISDNFDSKNLKTKGSGAIRFSNRTLIKDNIELDENGNPLVNKFLASHFSED